MLLSSQVVKQSQLSVDWEWDEGRICRSTFLWNRNILPPFSPVSVDWLAGWFVSRIMQKLLNRFPWNLDGGKRPGYVKVMLRRIKGEIQVFFVLFFHFLQCCKTARVTFLDFHSFLREQCMDLDKKIQAYLAGMCLWVSTFNIMFAMIYKFLYLSQLIYS